MNQFLRSVQLLERPPTNELIPRILAVRKITGMGLKEAKDVVQNRTPFLCVLDPEDEALLANYSFSAVLPDLEAEAERQAELDWADWNSGFDRDSKPKSEEYYLKLLQSEAASK